MNGNKHRKEKLTFRICFNPFTSIICVLRHVIFTVTISHEKLFILQILLWGSSLWARTLWIYLFAQDSRENLIRINKRVKIVKYSEISYSVVILQYWYIVVLNAKCDRNYLLTFFILDSTCVGSVNGSLKLGVGENPLLQRSIFLKRKDNDFLPMPLLVLSNWLSFPLLRTALLQCWICLPLPNILLTLLLFSRLVSCLAEELHSTSGSSDSRFNSFWGSSTSSGVRSCRWSWLEASVRWRFLFSISPVGLLFPNVPIASSPSGQSLNSSFEDSCRTRSIDKRKPKTWATQYNPYHSMPISIKAQNKITHTYVPYWT